MINMMIKIISLILSFCITIINPVIKELPILYEIKTDQAVLGDLGRLYIPSVYIKVRLFQVKAGDGRAQYVTDAIDSAAYNVSYHGVCGFIADHWNQGFIALKKVTFNDKAYIKTNNSIKIYKCVKICYGSNNGKNLTTYNGEEMGLIHWADFCCYTCDRHWTHVYMCFFKFEREVTT